jgi:thioredoxin-dependent peroxiredoxin
MKRMATAFAAIFSLAVITAARGADVELKEGDPAPKFSSTDDNGKPWKSEDYVGKKILVVYFYPADCTGGCTKQAQGFRDDLKELKERG